MSATITRFLVIAAAVLLVAGCAAPSYTVGMKPWHTLRESDFRQLVAGKSTKEDVIRILGTPYQQSKYPGKKEEVWDYLYPDNSFTMLAWVVFDEAGTYKGFSSQLHPSIYSSAGQ